MKLFGKKRNGGAAKESLILEEMKETMAKMNEQMQAQNLQMKTLMQKQHDSMTGLMRRLGSSDEEETAGNENKEPIECGSFEITHKNTNWHVAGYTSVIPDPDFDYFPGLNKRPATSFTITDGSESSGDDEDKEQQPPPPAESPVTGTSNVLSDKIISAIIPCYNEDGTDLDRTIRGLSRQIMPKGWHVELVIVMDGVEAMSDSMAKYLAEKFGVVFKSGDKETDPFELFPNAQTIVIHPVSVSAGKTRVPVMDNTTGGFSLVVKRKNKRKANSQMWWLGPHATAIGCKYSLATDCGTYFERMTTSRLIDRLDAEINTHAVTGFQRTMPSDIQGDGNFEACTHPFHSMLRNLQRFEFEVDHVSFMNIYDTLGAMHVIPGPCGLFRYSKLGSLKEGLMHEYFKLFTRSNKGLILGNVELVEDRIPGTLLAFPPKPSKLDPVRPPEGWSRTGFVHDAIFYMEAEKPLSQLVKQRRRWLNGTFATYIWMLQEGIILNSNQDAFTRTMSWILVVLSVLQGFVVRLFGPALNIVWMFRFGLFIQDLYTDPGRLFDPEVNLLEVEIEDGRLKEGIICGGLYLILYIAFVAGHTPRAKPIQDEISIVRYTEPSRYKNDSKSAYRGWIFHAVLWINFVVIVLYILNAIGILCTRGWLDTPLSVRILILFCFLPFTMAFIEGILRCNFRPLVHMTVAAPMCIPLMIWFTIWLPAYATTRLSDLTWGNRERDSIDETENALTREANGRMVSRFLIVTNAAVAIGVIICMQFHGEAFPIFVLSYTLVLSATYCFSFLDAISRAVWCGGSRSNSSEDVSENSYSKMDDETHASDSSSGSSWNLCGFCANGTKKKRKLGVQPRPKAGTSRRMSAPM